MFQIVGIAPEPFAHLFDASDDELALHNAKRYIADERPGFPCRVSLEDAAIGERVILVHFEHHAEATPYRASHAIFVREHARPATPGVDEIPQMIRHRLISVRSFDRAGWMLDADAIEGTAVESVIARMFEDERTAYLHLHFARRGCFAARVERSAVAA